MSTTVKNYRGTFTYHGIVKMPIFGGFIFNHGTASAKNTRTKVHKRACTEQKLTYEVLQEKQDRLFGTDVIAPSYDKEFIIKIVEQLNNTVLKNSTCKAKTLKDWKCSLPVLPSIDQGYYDALCKANLSETECCFIPDVVSEDDLENAISTVEKNWYYKNTALRISAKAYSAKTTKEKEHSAKPMPIAYCAYVLKGLNSYVAVSSWKKIFVQSLYHAHLFSLQVSLKNLQEIRVLVTGDDKEKYAEVFKLLKTDPRFQLVECESDSEVLEEYKKLEKFDPDYVLMNPPYKGNLHLKILEEVLSSVKASCIVESISPIRWLQDPNAVDKKNSDFNVFKNTVYDKISYIKQIPARDGQEAFGIVLTADLGIYTFNSTDSSVAFTGLIPKTVYKVLDKLISKPTIEKNKQDGWRVRIPDITGGKSGGRGGKKWYGLGFLGPFYNGVKDGKYWYEFYTKNQYTKTTKEISKSIRFNTEVEAVNFCDSLKTAFGRYITYNLIPDTHVNAGTLMWLEDYTKPWTNERLCEHFNISGFISDSQAVPGSEWEEILDFVEKRGLV